MNEVRIANYTLLFTVLLLMTTFWVSIQSLSKSTEYRQQPTPFLSLYR